jgi:hypothetical protein
MQEHRQRNMEMHALHQAAVRERDAHRQQEEAAEAALAVMRARVGALEAERDACATRIGHCIGIQTEELLMKPLLEQSKAAAMAQLQDTLSVRAREHAAVRGELEVVREELRSCQISLQAEQNDRKNTQTAADAAQQECKHLRGKLGKVRLIAGTRTSLDSMSIMTCCVR